MSGQIYVRRARDVALGRSSLVSKSAARGMRSSADPPAALGRKWPSFSDAGAGRLAFKAASAASAPRRGGVELGIFFHLACVGVVGAVIIAVFFGAGLYSLGRPAGQLISWAHEGGAPASFAGLAPSGADSPPIFETSLGALGASSPDATHRSATEVPRSPAPQSGATAKALDTPSEPRPEPTQGRGNAYSDLKRPRDASAEFVTGTVIAATDAMTWVIDDQIVRLWGIRPGPRNLYPSLSNLVDWVRAKGPVNCHKHAHSGRYQCITETHEDIAEAVLSAGVGRAANGATVAYRSAEAEAHRQGKDASSRR